MAKVMIQHPGPRSLNLGITPGIAKELYRVTLAAVDGHYGDFTLHLSTHGAKLTRGMTIIHEEIFIHYRASIATMRIMSPEEAVERWRFAINAALSKIEKPKEHTHEQQRQPALF